MTSSPYINYGSPSHIIYPYARPWCGGYTLSLASLYADKAEMIETKDGRKLKVYILEEINKDDIIV